LDNLKTYRARRADMSKALVKARKVGGSLMITIPKELVEQEDIKEGEIIEVEVRKARKSGFGLTPGIGHFTHEDELDTHL
jgi:bifunctional DNA-binding transcriptional regulator/antitoxin component of YhaV-PrlF toxin-antitoxin module